MKTTAYFEKTLVERPEIKREWCERVLHNPLRVELQPNGRYSFWGLVPEFGGRALRLITLEDKATVLNAYFDRNFLKRYQKENRTK